MVATTYIPDKMPQDNIPAEVDTAKLSQKSATGKHSQFENPNSNLNPCSNPDP